jgi:hypothetical protein
MFDGCLNERKKEKNVFASDRRPLVRAQRTVGRRPRDHITVNVRKGVDSATQNESGKNPTEQGVSLTTNDDESEVLTRIICRKTQRKCRNFGRHFIFSPSILDHDHDHCRPSTFDRRLSTTATATMRQPPSSPAAHTALIVTATDDARGIFLQSPRTSGCAAAGGWCSYHNKHLVIVVVVKGTSS